MFDTLITMVGNVLTAPQWRRTTQTGTFMVTFRVGSTSRRYDRDRNTWIDGDSLRVRVTCWRRLAENVSASVQLGDPVIVHGRMHTRDWTDEEGNRRSSYELDAVTVGHDLTRGVDKFARRKAVGSTDMVASAATEARVAGELTEAIGALGRPADLPPDDELFEPFDASVFDGTPLAPVGTGEPDDGGASRDAGEPDDGGASRDAGEPEEGAASRDAGVDEELVGEGAVSGRGPRRSGS